MKKMHDIDKGIVWLASYPKSGNTWFRIVLANALNQTNAAVNINQLHHSRSVSSRDFINQALGLDSRLLNQDELDLLRPAIHTWYAKQKRWFLKTHNAYFYLKNDQPFHQCEGCFGAVYFIRNPLDVAVSFASHCNIPIDVSIKIMSNKTYKTPLKIGANKSVPERYLSWSEHVRSWAQTDMNVLFTRYEDMNISPLQTFQKIFNFLQINIEPDDLLKKLECSKIENLQQQEQQFGFKEKSQRQKDSFFRKGIVGDWETTLTSRQVHQIIKNHDEMMYKFGYIDENSRPIRCHTET